MVRHRFAFFLCTVVTLAGVPGCSPLRPPTKTSSPLTAARMSSDSVTLDVFFVRCPYGDPVANDTLWQQIDEQQIPLETRARLAENGFRVGVIGGQMPVALSQLLELKGKPAPGSEPTQQDLTTIGSEEGTLWSHKQLRAGKRSEIVTSETYDELPVLLCSADGVSGQSYRKAQGVLAVTALPKEDGRVELQITPELHHDEVRRNFRGDHGAWRVDMARPREPFDEMAIGPHLTPGHMIVISSLPNRPGSLGHHFLTSDSAGKLEQKLLVLRLSQTQHDSLFEPSALPLDDVL